ncbi:MAG: PAS domain S-box protein, partial [Alphaproteobacteria bacterium]|nr:PAS domain S-box protein [Alphaproteobacteria bacterium]
MKKKRPAGKRAKSKPSRLRAKPAKAAPGKTASKTASKVSGGREDLARLQAAYGAVQRRLEQAIVGRTRELARRTRLIRLTGDIAQAAAEAETVPDILRAAVDRIGAYLGWPVGHVYEIPEGYPGPLVSTDIWQVTDEKRYGPFREASISFDKPGKGILFRAVAEGQTVWMESLADPKAGFRRAGAAKGTGLESGVMIPIHAAGKPIAVLEFYTAARAPADAAIVPALNQIAVHIGQVAERVAARAALHRSEAILSAVFAAAVDPIIVIDEKGIVQSANPAVERVFGYGRAEIVGRSVSLLMPADIAREHDGYLEKYLRTGRAHIIGTGREVTARRKSGETFPADLTVSEIDMGGRRLFAGTLRDLSARRAAERDLAAARQRLTDALAEVRDGIALYDRDQRLVMCNPSYRDDLTPIVGDIVTSGMS